MLGKKALCHYRNLDLNRPFDFQSITYPVLLLLFFFILTNPEMLDSLTNFFSFIFVSSILFVNFLQSEVVFLFKSKYFCSISDIFVLQSGFLTKSVTSVVTKVGIQCILFLASLILALRAVLVATLARIGTLSSISLILPSYASCLTKLFFTTLLSLLKSVETGFNFSGSNLANLSISN